MDLQGDLLPGAPHPLLQFLSQGKLHPLQEGSPVKPAGFLQVTFPQGLAEGLEVRGNPGPEDLVPLYSPRGLQLVQGHGEAIQGVLGPGPEELGQVPAGLGPLQG